MDIHLQPTHVRLHLVLTLDNRAEHRHDMPEVNAIAAQDTQPSIRPDNNRRRANQQPLYAA